MSIQVVLKNIGGVIETQFLDRQPTSCSVTLYTNAGAAKVTAQTCTIDPLSTTLAADSSAGDTTIALTSAASCIAGRRYLVGDYASSMPPEVVTVRGLTASTATLMAPLMGDHPVSTAVKGTRVWYSVSAAACDNTWINGFADFNPNDGSDVQTEHVECYLRKIPEKGCDETDLRLVFADGAKALSDAMDVPAAIKQARDRFLYDLGGKNRAHAFIGTDVFRQAVAIKFWLLRKFEFGADWADQMKTLQSEYDGLIELIQQQNPADNDQDGTTNGLDDGGFIVATLERA